MTPLLTRPWLMIACLLPLWACERAPAPQAPTSPAPAPTQAQATPAPRAAPVPTTPLPAAPPVSMDDIPWRQHSYTATLDDGRTRTFQLKDGAGRLPGPQEGQWWAMFLHEVSYGDLDNDGRQDAAVGLSWHLEVPQAKGPPKRTRSHALILFYNQMEGDRPSLAAQHQQPGHAIQWLDITGDIQLSAGVLTRPDAKFNAVEELTLAWEGGQIKVLARHKSYSD